MLYRRTITKRKVFVLFSVLLVLGLFLVGCGGGNGSEDEDSKSVYLVDVRTGGAAWTHAQQGFEDAINELGWEGKYVSPTTANDTSQMANLFETAITNKADAILGVFYSQEIFGNIAERAKDEGIVVGTVNVGLGGLEDFRIGTDQYGIDKAQAEALIEMADGKPVKVVFMVMSHGSETTQMMYQGFEETVKGHDNIKIHGIEVDDNDPIKAADIISNLRKLDPEINAVICTNSSGASLGIGNYVSENSLEDEMYTVGIDASADILNYVKSGALTVTLDQNFYKMGYEGVMLAKAVLEGKEVPKATDSGVTRVTKDMVEDYAKEKGVSLDN